MSDYIVDDLCRCPMCRAASDLKSSLLGLVTAGRGFEHRLASPPASGPAVAVSPMSADAQRPALRGPVQDESVSHDLLDELAMRDVEGRNTVADMSALLGGAGR